MSVWDWTLAQRPVEEVIQAGLGADEEGPGQEPYSEAEVVSYVEHWFWRHGSTPRGGGVEPDEKKLEQVFTSLAANLPLMLRADTVPEAPLQALPPGPVPRGARLTDDRFDAGPGTCILAQIDDAFSPFHPRLTTRLDDGTRLSRVAAAWMMGAARQGGIGHALEIGREITGRQLGPLMGAVCTPGFDEDGAMRRAGLWDASRGPLHAGGRAHGHGAAVADLFAGYASDDPVGRSRPIIAVGLPPEITRDTEGTFAPWFVYVALRYVLGRARALADELRLDAPPLVINLSYGVTAGDKEGGGLLPDKLARIVDAIGLPGGMAEDRSRLGEIAITVPMGNQRRGRLRARLEPGGSVDWCIPPADGSPNFLEVWGPPRIADGEPRPALRITPVGAPPFDLTPDWGWERSWAGELGADGTHVMRAYGTVHENPQTGSERDVVTLAVPPTEPEPRATGPLEPRLPGDASGAGRPGLWRIESRSGVPLDLFVQRDDAVPGFGAARRQSRLCPVPGGDDPGPIRENGTVNAYAAVPSSGGPGFVRVGALIGGPARLAWREGEADPGRPDAPRLPSGTDAPYSALGPEVAAGGDAPARPPEGDAFAVADRSANLPGIPVRGNTAGAASHGSGTSFAAPQVARRISRFLGGGGTMESWRASEEVEESPG